MWYVFDKNNICIGRCDFEPDKRDLATRGETTVENDLNINISNAELSNGVVNEKAVTVTLAEAQTTKLSELKSAAARAYVVGFSSSATGTALWYDSDENTQSQITNAGLLAIASTSTFDTMYPSGLTIRAKASSAADDSTKVKYTHTAAQIITLGEDMQFMLSTVKTKLWAKQEAVYAATIVDVVNAITWTSTESSTTTTSTDTASTTAAS